MSTEQLLSDDDRKAYTELAEEFRNIGKNFMDQGDAAYAEANRLAKLVNDDDLRRWFGDEEPTLEKIMGIDWNKVTGDWHKKCSDVVSSLRGIYQLGLWKDTNQASFSVVLQYAKLDLSIPISEQVDVAKVMVFVKPLKDGTRRIQLSDAEACATGIYYLVAPESEGARWRIIKQRYGHEMEFGTYKNLESALQVALKIEGIEPKEEEEQEWERR